MERGLKRGQAAAGAAVLVAIILGLLITFIVLIPPSERAELLGDEKSSNVTSRGSLGQAAVRENLLTLAPGKIDFLGQLDIEHPLPVVNIYTRTESKIIAEKNVALAKRGIFSEETDTFSFSIPDYENTEDALLSFNVENVKGRLIISLNGEKIYNSDLTTESVQPVRLPKNLLKEKNEMIFRVSSPGLAFWVTNSIALSGIQIVGDVTSLEAQSSTNIFLISETEKRNLDRVILKFQPDCVQDEIGKLSVNINGEQIYEGVPDCDLAFVPIELSPAVISAGENQIMFRAERGTYVLSHVLLQSQLKEVEFPTYYFQLSTEQYQQLRDAQRKLRVELNFVDAISRKYGELIFNGRSIPFDTDEAVLTIEMSTDAVQGNNALKIKPQKTIEVRELKLDLVS